MESSAFGIESRAFGIRHSTFGIPPRRQRDAGFALLITVTLLAFLVLLLVSLASLTRVETQVAANTQDLARARQNALLALSIALGELQKAAGPDQRATATAGLGDGATAITAAQLSSNGLVTPVNGTRSWTGVWGDKASPDTLFTAAPQPVLLRWLVSGNETGASVITAAPAGNITAPASAATLPFNPAQPVVQADGSALSAATTATTALTINAKPAALLLGPKTAGTAVAAYAAAPLVELTSTQVAGLSGTSRIGRYAWWIGDEGVKARYNLPDPYIAAATPDSAATTASRDSRYRLLAAQRNGIEKITAFANANYPLAATSPTDPLYLGVGKTLTPAAIRLASPAVDSAQLQASTPDLTTYSCGVLADSHFGGLRRDLTFHLDPQSGDTFLDGRDILPDGATPVSAPSAYPGSKYSARPSLYSETVANGGLGFTTLNISPRLGPKWDQLKSYYKMAYDHPTNLEVQPAVDIDANPVKVQGAVTPVILESRFLFALKSGPSIDTSVILVIGNPYTRPLVASSGLNFRVAVHPNNYNATRQDSQEWGIMCSYIGPVLPGFEGQSGSTATTQNHHNITSVFTRFYSGLSGSKVLFASPYQSEANPNAQYYGQYYPILKLPPGRSGDGPPEPDKNNPALLERVYFQIPPGVLNLAPGEAKAYRIDPSTTLPDETVNGNAFQVIPLQEMTDGLPTYITLPCDPHFINDTALLPPGLLTGAPLASGTEIHVGLTLAATGGLDYILTLPGKPSSVLQNLGPCSMYTTATQNGGIPNTVYDTGTPFDNTDPFHSSYPAAGAGRSIRVFGNHVTSPGQPVVHAEASMLGSFQPTSRYYDNKSATTSSLLRTTPFTLSSDTFTSKLYVNSASQAAWGFASYTGAAALNGNGALPTPPNGKFVLNDIPGTTVPGEIPFLSLAQLSGLDLTADDEALGTDAQPAYAVGNSRYCRFVSRSATATDPQPNYRSQWHSNSSDTSATALGDSPTWYSGYVPDLPKQTSIRLYDISYLLNAALWDSAFFSTVRPSAASDPTVAPLPANRRLVYASVTPPTLGQLRGSDSSAAIPLPSALVPGENGRAPAAQMLINGAFNINSTSVPAWIAVLSGLRGLGANGIPATPASTPVAHSIRQTGAIINDNPANPATPFITDSTYTGFRALTDPEIATLATQIVAQVKARGPFLSLAQFINRNLTAAATFGDPVADTGLSGALQQAIDRSSLNTFLMTSSTAVSPVSGSDSVCYPDNAFMPSGTTSGLSLFMNVPGWLSQSDLLQSLAPILSSRSDTFIIRTCGEALDPINSPAAPAAPVVKTRAWCEAVVQRLPDYVDSTQRPTLPPALANPLNQTLGRRFRIVSFRWLTPDDI